MITQGMAAAKRKGLANYGLIAQRYIESFTQRSLSSDSPPRNDLLSSVDIQSVADFGNSYGMVRDLRTEPFGLEDISYLAAATAAPLVPLLLAVFSPEELVMRIFQVAF